MDQDSGINRRNFLGAIAGTAAVTSAMGAMPAMAAKKGSKTQSSIIKPKRLVPGMTVGLVAPASNSAENEGIRFAIDIVKSLGFKVKEGKYLFERNQYLAGTDKQRADDVNRMFADDSVDAIFCVRGGYGTPRILPYLDYKMIRKNPKVFLGYSDITAILNALYSQSNLMSYHGPIAKQNFSEYTLAEFKKVLVNPQEKTQIAAAPLFEAVEGTAEKDNRLTRFVGGKARGRLIGGNLSLLSKLIGTPYCPDFKDAILVLEDVGEAPYRIDGMLTQLWLAGKLQEVAGIAIGKFTEAETSDNTFSVEEVIEQRCVPLKVPTIRGLMIGHIDDQTVVPIGAMAELDVDAGTLTLLESAVS